MGTSAFAGSLPPPRLMSSWLGFHRFVVRGPAVGRRLYGGGTGARRCNGSPNVVRRVPTAKSGFCRTARLGSPTSA